MDKTMSAPGRWVVMTHGLETEVTSLPLSVVSALKMT